MVNPFRVLGSALRDLFDDFLLLLICNMIWAALSLPIWWLAFAAAASGAGALGAILAMLGVLPAGPATAGLIYVAHKVADGRAAKVADYFTGLRTYVRPAWVIAAIWVAGMLVVLFNLSFWFGAEGIFGALLLGLWLYVLLFWLGGLIYAPALVFLQEQPDLRLVGRNAFLMVMGRPLFTLITLLLMGVLFVLSLYLVLPVFLVTIAFYALWGMRATMALIADARRRREAAEAASAPPPEERGRKGQVRPK